MLSHKNPDAKQCSYDFKNDYFAGGSLPRSVNSTANFITASPSTDDTEVNENCA